MSTFNISLVVLLGIDAEFDCKCATVSFSEPGLLSGPGLLSEPWLLPGPAQGFLNARAAAAANSNSPKRHVFFHGLRRSQAF